LEDLFVYNGSGVMPGRTWIIAPDVDSLEKRWQTLIDAPAVKKEVLFHPHLSNGKLGDRHSKRLVQDGSPVTKHQPSRLMKRMVSVAAGALWLSVI